MNYQFVKSCHAYSLIKALFLIYKFYVVHEVQSKRIIVVGSGATKHFLRGGLISITAKTI